MESTGKIIMWVVIALLVVGGVYYWYMNRGAAPAPAAQPSAQAQAPAPVSTLPSGTDTSDAALTQDAAAISGTISAMGSDTAAIDSGLNDKPVSQ